MTSVLRPRVPACAIALFLACLPACSDGGSSSDGLGATGDGGSGGRSGNGGAAGLSIGTSGHTGAGGSSGQSAAPVGYCPGVDTSGAALACWDGHAEGCRPCYAPNMPRVACSGVLTMPPATPRLPACASDDDCSRRGAHCEPGHPFADAQGCRPTGCDEGAECLEGMVCDPSSPLAGSLHLAPGGAGPLAIPGCRVSRCDEPGGLTCPFPLLCDPAGSTPGGLGDFGCRFPTCSDSAACPTGTTCSNGICALIACNEPGGTCPEHWRCGDNGCQAISCSEPDGVVCERGTACNGSGIGIGCEPLACDQPGALPCPASAFCAETAPGTSECVECITNEDCGCGSCIGHLCYDRPGYCEPGCG